MKTTIISISAALMVALIPFNTLAQHSHENHGNHRDHGGHHSMKSDEQYAVSETFQDQLTSVYEHYLNLKDALVSGSVSTAKEYAGLMKGELKQVDMSLLKGDAHMEWMKHLKVMKEYLADVQAASDLSGQREAFAPLSNALSQSVKAFGVKGMAAYYQYCPMARNGEGAYWLSNDEGIRNPYYGSSMMKCGKTIEQLN